MTMLMGQQKLWISEPPARLEGEAEERSDQIIQLEIAERIPARFGGIAVIPEGRRESMLGEDGALGR